MKKSPFLPAGPIGSSLLGGALVLVGMSVQAAPATPYAATQAPTAIRAASAVLNGMATPNGRPTVAWFEWRSGSSELRATDPAEVGEVFDVVPINTVLTNLPAFSVFTCRLVVSNATGIVRGRDLLFTTGGKIAAWGVGAFFEPPKLSNVVAVASGAVHGLALRNDGALVAWGAETQVPTGLNNAVAIASGGFHSLALKEDGTVLAWGDNGFGQTNVPAGLNDVAAVAAGAEHSLALRKDGTVVAWGNGSDGRTQVPAGLSNVVAIAAGSHSLALRHDGTVVAWGNNLCGQTNVPVGLDQVVDIACGYQYSLALREDGTVTGWGSNDTGQTYVPPNLGNVRAVAGGELHSLAVRSDGKVAPWGVDLWFGQHEVPADLSHAVSVAIGHDRSLALCLNAPPDAWPNSAPRATPQWAAGPAGRDLTIGLSGSDFDGDPMTFRITTLPALGSLYQYADEGRGAAILAPGTTVSDAEGRILFAPEPDGGGDPYTDFAFLANDGERNSWPATVEVSMWGGAFAATQPATVSERTQVTLNGMATPNGWPSLAWFEWGSDVSYGQSTDPAEVGDGNSVVRVTAGISNLLEHQVIHYRLVVSNSLGVATGIDQLCVTGAGAAGWGADSYGQATVPGTWDDLVAIWGAMEHSLALRSDGTVVAWGNNDCGQTNVPAGLSNVVAVIGGFGRSVVLRADGTVVAWGCDYGGQTSVPAGLNNIVAIDGFDQNFAALRNDGRVVTWGVNHVGEMDVPKDLKDVVAVSAGSHHVLALRSNGTVVSWGWCEAVPIGLSGVVAVAAGGFHNLALRDDGTVVAWGWNNAGQTNVPAGLSDVMVVAAGYAHSLALRSDGTIVAWGANENGQTTVPSGLTNIVAIKAGAAYNLAMKAAPVAPRLASEPQSQTVVHGANASFSVVASGTPPLSYEWQRDGRSLAGATRPTLTLPHVTRLDAGNYRVIVTNTLGSALSSNAYLRVLVPQQIHTVSQTSSGALQLWFGDSIGGGGARPSDLEIQAATNLLGTNTVWTLVTFPEPILTNGIFLFEEADAINYPQRFYRIVER